MDLTVKSVLKMAAVTALAMFALNQLSARVAMVRTVVKGTAVPIANGGGGGTVETVIDPSLGSS